jgi:hypothetical protein
MSIVIARVLATFVICPPNWTFSDIFTGLPSLRMSQRESRIDAFTCSSS